MPNYLGADIGYSNLKVAMTTAPDVKTLKGLARGDIEVTEDGPKFDILNVPAGAMLASKRPMGIFSESKETNEIRVTVNKEDWVAGVDFSTASLHGRELTSNFLFSNEWQALFLASLKWSGFSVVDKLVLGLPCREYFESIELVEKLIEFAKGEHIVDGQNTVEVKKVVVTPQPLGSLMGYLLSDATAEEEKILTGRTTALISDPGYYSHDWVVINNDEVVFTTSGSSQHSVGAVCADIKQQFAEKYPGTPLPDGEIEQVIRDGTLTVFVGGEYRDITEQLEIAAKRISDLVLKPIRSTLANQNIQPRVLMVTGGGASIFSEHLHKGIAPSSLLLTSEASVVMNAFGYLRMAIEGYEGLHLNS
jgi:plasmid segregation protein ParM